MLAAFRHGQLGVLLPAAELVVVQGGVRFCQGVYGLGWGVFGDGWVSGDDGCG